MLLLVEFQLSLSLAQVEPMEVMVERPLNLLLEGPCTPGQPYATL